MTTKIINNNKYNWTSWEKNNIEIFIKGSFWHEGNYFSGESACRKLIELSYFNDKKIDETHIKFQYYLSQFIGNFALIIKSPYFVIAAVDKVRSYPIFYSIHETEFLNISNCADNLIENITTSSLNDNAVTMFKMSGYCLGKETILKNINQLQPGSLLFFVKGSIVKTNKYYKYFPNEKPQNKNDSVDKLHEITMSVFSRMIESFNGAPVFLPLSGGLDSRLILVLLKKLKYDNITTYTYGKKGVWEIERAKYIAEKLGVKWHFIELKQTPSRKLFHTKEREEYFKFAGGLNSAPHLAEYYALLKLRKQGLIPNDAIIINGQSGDFTSGGHIPEFLKTHHSDQIDINIFTETIINKHFSLWSNLKTKENKKLVSNRIIKSLSLENRKFLSKREFASHFEMHEWEERQSKYVINGQRAYDWFNYKWRLPLWDDELMEFWKNVNWEDKIGQKLLLEYLNKYNFYGMFKNTNLPAQYSYFPTWAKLIKPFFYILSVFSDNDVQYYYHKYLKYYMTYGAFYTQKNYLEFIKSSKWHRNSVSYWVHNYLGEIIKKR